MTTPPDYSAYGFLPCEFDPDECEGCDQVRPLFFGSDGGYEPREGTYLCGECIEKMVADNEAAYAEAMLNFQDSEPCPEPSLPSANAKPPNVSGGSN